VLNESTEHRKTKILVTMGPSLENKLDEVIDTIDGVRFNMSHASINQIKRVLEVLEKHNIAKLMDLKGNKIRVKKAFKYELKEGEEAIIGKDIILTYNPVELNKGNLILINDGKIKLEVKDVVNELIFARVIRGGIVKEGMGINLPDASLKMPIISDEDIEHIKFAVENDFEYIALSFVRNKDDIINLRNIIKDYNGDSSIIAKIETREGLNNIEDIVKFADGVIIARGDLGVEIPIEYIPIEQKNIMAISNKYGKLTITATQMLDSMINNPYPTRAEVTDIANAIFDGTDCLMLSNETTIGKYPVEAIRTMDTVARVSEKNIEKFGKDGNLEEPSVSTGIAYATHTLYNKLDPKIIITPTRSGKTAILISKFKPTVPIIAPTPNLTTLRKLKLFWGVSPCIVDEVNHIDKMLDISREIAKKEIKEGTFIITLGHPIGENKTNVIKVEII